MSKWYTLSTKDDINNFIDESWGFHDSCIYEIKYVSGEYVNPEDKSMRMCFGSDTKIHLILHSQAPIGNMEIEFSQPQLVHINEWQRDMGEILGAYLGKEIVPLFDKIAPYIIWSPDGWFNPKEFDTKTWTLESPTVIIAKEARWRKLEV